MTRRESFKFAAGGVAALSRPQDLFGPRPLSLKPISILPPDFIGFGYEKSSVAIPGLLDVSNAPYLELVRNLGANGSLRIGGIVADFSQYQPNGQMKSEPKNTVVTRENLRRLRSFLDATGWTAIWSLNFGGGSLDQAVLEARDVAAVLGPRLAAIELGNEVENYGRGTMPLRTTSYQYEDFRSEYARWHSAIITAIPGLRFAGPDTASSVEWVERLAHDSRGEVQLLTTHYYLGGQKEATFDQLLQPDHELRHKLERLSKVSKSSGVPWRICETNSFFGGGRPGISDSLASALWTLDYLLLLAQYGCAGVNLETGVNQLGFVSSYSPIKDNGSGKNSAGSPYYGMLAFAYAVNERPHMLPFVWNPPDQRITLYALGKSKRIDTAIVINKSVDVPVKFALRNLGFQRATIIRLLGDSLSATSGLTLGGSSVTPSGQWNPIRRANATTVVEVAPASAAVIRLAC